MPCLGRGAQKEAGEPNAEVINGTRTPWIAVLRWIDRAGRGIGRGPAGTPPNNRKQGECGDGPCGFEERKLKSAAEHDSRNDRKGRQQQRIAHRNLVPA